MRRRLLFDFACSLRLIDGQAPLAFAPARLSVRRSPLRGAGAWEYLSITERHVAGSYARHHISIEGRRRNRWGIALRFTGRWTLFLSWSVSSAAEVQDVIEEIFTGGPLMHIFPII